MVAVQTTVIQTENAINTEGMACIVLTVRLLILFASILVYSFRCSCNTGYQGADCSERICPFGLAWADKATDIDVAHAESECSNRGICNRKNG